MEDDDDLGNPWLAIVIGIALLAFAWYVFANFGVETHLQGKRAIGNTSWGRILGIGFGILGGGYFLCRGIAKLRSGD